MSSQYPPLEDGNFASQNFLNTEDDKYTLEELERIFAKKFNMSVSGTSTIEGQLTAQEINITDNKTIMLNANPLHTYNKCKRYEYVIQHNEEKSFINIPINVLSNNSSNNQARIYLCSLTRADGIFSILNSNPVFCFYLICSDVSVLNPIILVSNQISSYNYSEIDRTLTIDFDRVYSSDLKVLFSMNQIQ